MTINYLKKNSVNIESIWYLQCKFIPSVSKIPKLEMRGIFGSGIFSNIFLETHQRLITHPYWRPLFALGPCIVSFGNYFDVSDHFPDNRQSQLSCLTQEHTNVNNEN